MPGEDVVGEFERRCEELGLIARRMSLKKYPGCTHWHLKKAGEKGTLEATWWPEKDRLWLSVHENRRAAWQERAIRFIDV